MLLDEHAGEELRLTVPARRKPARPVGHDPLRHRQSQPREHKEAVVHGAKTARSRSAGKPFDRATPPRSAGRTAATTRAIMGSVLAEHG